MHLNAFMIGMLILLPRVWDSYAVSVFKEELYLGKRVIEFIGRMHRGVRETGR